jgi:hypothetical protein
MGPRQSPQRDPPRLGLEARPRVVDGMMGHRDGALDRLHVAITDMLDRSRVDTVLAAEAVKKAMKGVTEALPLQLLVQGDSPLLVLRTLKNSRGGMKPEPHQWTVFTIVWVGLHPGGCDKACRRHAARIIHTQTPAPDGGVGQPGGPVAPA